MNNSYDFKVAHPDITKQLSVKDILFTYYRYPQLNKQVNLSTHDNLILYTICGKQTFYHLEKRWVVSDDSCVFVRRTAFSQERDDLVDWEVLAFYFGNDFLRQVFGEYRQHLPLKNLPPPPAEMLLQIRVSEITRAFFYSMIPYFTQKLPPAEILLELKFKELLFHVLSDQANKELLSYINSTADQERTPLWQVMETNYTCNLSIEEFARMAGRSVAAFKREFKEYYHTSPGKWLTNKRLEYAKLLLATSKKSVGDIAHDSGFENLTHFSRVFKDKHGLSPLQYRKKGDVTGL
jgi:AraC-like DNA-binding protein